jgi:hypothetical protein
MITFLMVVSWLLAVASCIGLIAYTIATIACCFDSERDWNFFLLGLFLCTVCWGSFNYYSQSAISLTKEIITK